MEYILFAPMSASIDYNELVPSFSRSTVIPKKIFQLCRDKDDLHERIQANIAYLKGENPDWSYTLYDNPDFETYIRDHYGERILSYYLRIDPVYGAARADFFRYLLIYREGGVYLDIKSSLTQPLDQILSLDDQYLLGHWDNDPGGSYEGWGYHKELIDVLPRGEYQQYYICSVSGHPFLREVIKRVLMNIDSYQIFRVGVGFKGVLRTTGPIAYSLAIEDCRQKHPLESYRLIDHKGKEKFIFNIYGNLSHKVYTKSFYNVMTKPIIVDTPPYQRFIYDIYRRVKAYVISQIKSLRN